MKKSFCTKEEPIIMPGYPDDCSDLPPEVVNELSKDFRRQIMGHTFPGDEEHRKWDDVDWSEKDEDIAAAMGVCRQTVTKHRKDYDIPTRRELLKS